MPRCYMVKKGTMKLEMPPHRSPSEASVAPPCYHPAVNEPRAAQNADCKQSAARPRGGDYNEGHGMSYVAKNVYPEPIEDVEPRSPDVEPERDAIPVDREYIALDYSRPHTPDYERPSYIKPQAVEYDEADSLDYEEKQAEYSELRSANYAEPPPTDYPEPRPANYIEPRPADYAEPRSDYNANRPAEPREAENAEPAGEYAELQNMRGAMVREHSAADTEAAHDLLSLAAGVPPVPPATVLTVLRASDPLVPLYTYTIQPTNIYIITDEQHPEYSIYQAVQAIAPLQQVEYATVEPQANSYITYQETVAPQNIEYQPVYRDLSPPPLVIAEPVGVPVSVIEATPPPMPQLQPAPMSVQVPVIEPVPLAQQNPPPAAMTTIVEIELEESTPVCLNEKRGKYDCAECGKCYATSSNLSRHKQTHRSLDSQAAKRCSECGKAYVSMPALAMHVLTHRMAHVCGVCGKQFSRPWLLRGHLRSHTGEKPYNCEFCSKAFADRSNLRAHLQTHSGDKKWECLRCNKTFALKSYLNKHQEASCMQDD